MSNSDSVDQKLIEQAVAALRRGELVAFPTETVYGLGADASSLTALERLYKAKGRPSNHPVIVHLASLEQLPDWAASVPPEAEALAAAFWPGPLTMILQRASGVLDQVTGGQPTVGLRVPSHPLALQLLRAFDGGLAAPSANKFGKLSPTTAQDVAADFADEVALVLDGGPCDVGIESTIVDLSTPVVRVLRPGMITADYIEDVLGQTVLRGGKSTTRVPGSLPAHYAPKTPVQLVASDKLEQTLSQQVALGKCLALLALEGTTYGGIETPVAQVIVAPRDPAAYARHLYHNLRRLDKSQSDLIVVEQVPAGGAWAGIADRLTRAAAEQVQIRGETA